MQSAATLCILKIAASLTSLCLEPLPATVIMYSSSLLAYNDGLELVGLNDIISIFCYFALVTFFCAILPIARICGVMFSVFVSQFKQNNKHLLRRTGDYIKVRGLTNDPETGRFKKKLA